MNNINKIKEYRKGHKENRKRKQFYLNNISKKTNDFNKKFLYNDISREDYLPKVNIVNASVVGNHIVNASVVDNQLIIAYGFGNREVKELKPIKYLK